MIFVIKVYNFQLKFVSKIIRIKTILVYNEVKNIGVSHMLFLLFHFNEIAKVSFIFLKEVLLL